MQVGAAAPPFDSGQLPISESVDAGGSGKQKDRSGWKLIYNSGNPQRSLMRLQPICQLQANELCPPLSSMSLPSCFKALCHNTFTILCFSVILLIHTVESPDRSFHIMSDTIRSAGRYKHLQEVRFPSGSGARRAFSLHVCLCLTSERPLLGPDS